MCTPQLAHRSVCVYNMFYFLQYFQHIGERVDKGGRLGMGGVGGPDLVAHWRIPTIRWTADGAAENEVRENNLPAGGVLAQHSAHFLP